MLSLKQSLGLNSIRPLGGWKPSDEGANLIAWYKNKVGITLNGSDVSAWADSSTNSHTMVQATASEQPAYNASTGALTFDASADQNLQTTTQMTFSGAFTIGLRLFPTADNAVVIGDNTTSNEFFKIITSTRLRFKTDGSQRDMDLDSGSLLTDNYLVITRNSSNLITIHFNGSAQSDTETLSGTADIDAIGVRHPDTNPYAGVIKEIQIFDTESTALTANVNTYLSNL